MAFPVGWSSTVKLVCASSQIPAGVSGQTYNMLVTQAVFDADDPIWSAAKSDGSDIRATDADPNSSHNKLACEVARFDATNKVLELYIARTVSSSSDFNIYLTFGNSGASATPKASSDSDGFPGWGTQWASRYTAVYHLNESGDGTADEYLDSTTNDNHAQGGGGTAAQVPDRVTGSLIDSTNGYAQDFTKSSTDLIECPMALTSAVYQVQAILNMENAPSTSDTEAVLNDHADTYGLTWGHSSSTYRQVFTFAPNYPVADFSASWDEGNWHLVAGARNEDQSAVCWLDGGLEEDTGDSNSNTTRQYAVLGSEYYPVDMLMEEARMTEGSDSSGYDSTAWQALTWSLFSSNSSHYTLSTEVNCSSVDSVVTSADSTVSNTTTVSCGSVDSVLVASSATLAQPEEINCSSADSVLVATTFDLVLTTVISCTSSDNPLVAPDATVSNTSTVDCGSQDSVLAPEGASADNTSTFSGTSVDSPLVGTAASISYSATVECTSRDSILAGESASITNISTVTVDSADSVLSAEAAGIYKPILAISADSVLEGEAVNFEDTSTTVVGVSSDSVLVSTRIQVEYPKEFAGYIPPRIISRSFTPQISQTEIDRKVKEILRQSQEEIERIALEQALPIGVAISVAQDNIRKDLLFSVINELYKDNRQLVGIISEMEKDYTELKRELIDRMEVLEHNTQAALIIGLSK